MRLNDRMPDTYAGHLCRSRANSASCSRPAPHTSEQISSNITGLIGQDAPAPNQYVQQVTLGNQPLQTPFISYADIMAGKDSSLRWQIRKMFSGNSVVGGVKW